MLITVARSDAVLAPVACIMALKGRDRKIADMPKILTRYNACFYCFKKNLPRSRDGVSDEGPLAQPTGPCNNPIFHAKNYRPTSSGTHFLGIFLYGGRIEGLLHGHSVRSYPGTLDFSLFVSKIKRDRS